MSFISLGQFNRKVKCLFVTVILSVIIFLLEHYFEVDEKFSLRENYLHLFTYYYSFSFLGYLVGGGICKLIIYLKSFHENRIKKQIKSKTTHKSLSSELIFNENNPYLFWQYFAFSAFFELMVNTTDICLVVEIIDLDSKILLSGLNILFIKIFSYKFLKYPIYRHQFITTIILSIFILITFFQRIIWFSNYAKDLSNENHDCTYENKYCNDTTFMFIERSKISLEYLIFFNITLLIGFILNGVSICYDKYIMQEKLCDPYKLIFFKGLFGFPVSLIIQILFRIFLKEERTSREKVDFHTILKRFSFPINGIFSNNVIYVIIFGIVVTFYKIFYIKTIDFYPPEILGFVSVISSVFASDIIQIIYLWLENNWTNIILCFVILTCVTFLSFVACEIIILHCLKFDENIGLNIDKRAAIEYTDNSINSINSVDTPSSSQNTSNEYDSSRLGVSS